MRIKLIACNVFSRELYDVSAHSPHIFETSFLALGLHNYPDKLREEIQSLIDSTDPALFDVIVLGYGLCSRATAGIEAKNIPIVIPKAHDCITLLLGSRERYTREFNAHPGTYYYSPGWVERKTEEVDQLTNISKEKLYDVKYKEYVEKYGEDNAKYLLDMECTWMDHYERVAFINMGIGNIKEYRRFTQELAKERGWMWDEIQGDKTILEMISSANWDPEYFEIINPGDKIAESYDENIICSSNCSE
ncbi:MAG: DUF1638 domain-containing protein [Armatimonadota bacterium]